MIKKTILKTYPPKSTILNVDSKKFLKWIQKNFLHNTAHSVQLPYIAGLSL